MVLDTQYYSDTLVWNTPNLPQDPNTGETFQHFVPIICPTADLGTATIDGTPLSLTGTPSSVINNSRYSAINPEINPGEHEIISPGSIYAIVAGFNDGDSYSVPQPVRRFLNRRAIPFFHAVILAEPIPPTVSCTDFIVSATLSAPTVAGGPARHDLAVGSHYLRSPRCFISLAIPAFAGAVLTGGGLSPVDSSTPGFVTVTIYGDPFLAGNDLFKLIFEGWRSVTATTVGKNGTPSYCGDDSETLAIQSVTFAVAPSTDTLDRQFLISHTAANVCEPLTITITTDSIVTESDAFVLENVEVQFDPASEHFISSTGGALLKNVVFTQNGQATGDYQLNIPTPPTLSGSDSLLALQFDPQSASAGDTMRIRIAYLECGDTLYRNFSIIFSVTPAADSGHAALTVTTSSVALGNRAEANVSLSGLPATANVLQFDLYLTYNHDLLTYDSTDLTGTLTQTWPEPTNTPGIATDDLHFTSLAPLGTVPGTAGARCGSKLSPWILPIRRSRFPAHSQRWRQDAQLSSSRRILPRSSSDKIYAAIRCCVRCCSVNRSPSTAQILQAITHCIS